MNCSRDAGESREVGLLDMVEMRADNSAITLDMSAIASSRRSAACKTREKDAWSQVVRILEKYGVWRVGRGCAIVLYEGVVVATASSLSMVAVGVGVSIVVNKVVVSSPSSEMGVVGVGVGISIGASSSSGLGLVVSMVSGMQREGVSLYVKGTT